MLGIPEIREWLDAHVPSVATFVLRRRADVTGVSGTGVVADDTAWRKHRRGGHCLTDQQRTEGERP